MKTLLLLVALGGAALGLTAPPASADTLCVGAKPACFAALQDAVEAAQDGDTIELAAGTFGGGLTVDVSVDIVGAGAGATVIAGGGPVITIGELFGTSTPTVSIGRVTITGGLNDSRPGPEVSAGGGVWIPPGAGNTTGATVTIRDSVITRNRVAPQATFPPGPFCGLLACAFAAGGGIDNAGRLTVTNTRISDNDSGPGVAGGSFGGGIVNHPQGTLTLRRSVVTGNRAAAVAPNGRLAVAGGISDSGALTIEDSVVSDNSVELESALPGEVNAWTGGIEVTGDGSATITRTAVRGNRVRASSAGGDLLAGVGGISTDDDTSLVLRDSAVDRNTVDVGVSAAGANAIAIAGGLELEGVVQVSGSSFVGNEVRVESPTGLAGAAGGGLLAGSRQPVGISDSVVTGNSVLAESAGGAVLAVGGGLVNTGLLTVRRARVTANAASARGPGGVAQGGGIQNWMPPLPDTPPVVRLELVDSVVAGNRLSGSPQIGLLGGGLFTEFPVTLTRTVVAGNSPDQCFGC